jgi:hypothetical protein
MSTQSTLPLKSNSSSSSSNSRAWEDDVSKILARLFARRDSELFREPVPYEELGLTDYISIVKTPSDLGTVKSRLESHSYQNALECAEDIRRIWYNAMLYNAPGATVYVKAKTLQEFWEAQWATFNQQDLNRPAVADDLRLFTENCYRISTEDMGKILNKIEKECPNALVKKPNTNEVEVNVDLIHGKTFRDVSTFAQKAAAASASIAV